VSKSVPRVVRWTFWLFAFTIPFESAALPGSASLAKLSGLVFLAAVVTYYNPLSRRKTLGPVPAACWWFAGYICVYLVNGLFISEDLMTSFLSRLITLVQLTVLLWIVSKIFEDEQLLRQFLLIYCVGSLLVALGALLNLPGFVEVVGSIDKERTTALGDDPNIVSIFMAVAGVTLIGLAVSRAYSQLRSYIVLPVMILPLLALMVSTGSRSGMLSFIAGCSTYLALVWHSKRKFIVIIVSVLAVSALVYIAISSPLVVERWEQTLVEGNMAGRENITPATIEMILERPLFGWQPIEIWYELNSRLGKFGERDTHNLFLHLLAEVGLVGSIPFFVGLWLCGRGAYKARSDTLGILPLALIVTILVANLGVTMLHRKPFWLILGIALATASRVAGPRTSLVGLTYKKPSPLFP
jgi:O-antigen ligase